MWRFWERSEKPKRDHNNDPIGKKNSNPILDSRIYELEFPDGRVEEYAFDAIAENLLEQADDEGWDSGMLAEVIDHWVDNKIAIPKSEGTITSYNGSKRNVITTKGWDLYVRWKDQSTSWVQLSRIKESNPVQVAEYAYANKIADQPAFKWWVSKVLKKRDCIVSRLKTLRCRKGRMKFGIHVPGSVEDAMKLDKANGNTLWQDAIEKEMKNASVAFQLLPRDDKPPVGFKEIICHKAMVHSDCILEFSFLYLFIFNL